MKNLNILLLMLMLSCTPEPKPIEYGSDMCHFCKMTVVDQQHGAEAVTSKGKVFMFDAIECMINHLDKQKDTDFAFVLVNNYENPGELIDARNSYFLISKNIPSPMGAYLSAFSSRNNASQMQQQKGGKIFNWMGIQQKITGKLLSNN